MMERQCDNIEGRDAVAVVEATMQMGGRKRLTEGTGGLLLV